MKGAPGEEKKEYLSTGQLIKVLQQKLEAGAVEEAADLYSRCHEDVGFVLMARLPRERPLQAKMAKMFFLARDYQKAALVLEANGELQRAAELYERTDQFENAAELWLKLDVPDRAAHNFEKAGLWHQAAELYLELNNYERAAYCFEKGINHFLAGKYYYQIHKFEKSMELLQKIREDEEHYYEAAVMIGNILALNGYLDLAIAKYLNVTRTVPLNAHSLTVYYNLAKLLEQSSQKAEAAVVYRQIENEFPNYRDVRMRLGTLGKEEALASPPEEETLEVGPLAEEVLPLEQAGAPAEVVAMMAGFEFLKSTSLFETLSLPEMKRLWNLCELRSFEPAEIIIEQDCPGEALFIVKWGTVEVWRREGEQWAKIAELGPGAHVGEMSLIDLAPTSARVTAGPDGVQVFEIHRSRFEELLESDARLALNVYKVFIQTLADRLRRTTSELSLLKCQAGG